MQAVMRKREGIEPRQTVGSVEGRAVMNRRRQHQRTLAPPGSETMACMKGQQWNLGDLLGVESKGKEPGFKFKRQGVMTKSMIILPTEVRCSRSSEEVE